MSDASSPFTRGVARIARLCAGIVCGLGVVVLIGWALNIHALKSVHPSLASMKANTAICFVLLGVALWPDAGGARRITAAILGAATMLLAGLTLTEYLANASLGVDELLFRDPVLGPNDYPGRMAFATSVNMLLFGFAVAVRPRLATAARVAALLAAAVAFTAFCGYLYGAQSLYRFGFYSSIALHTTLGFLVAFVAFAVEDATGFARLFNSRGTAGHLVRRVAPAILIVPVIIGRFALAGEQAALYDIRFGAALLVLGTVGSLGLLMWVVAERVDRYEARENAIATASLDGILVVDHEGRLVDFSPAAETLFGYRRRDVIGKAVAHTLVPPVGLEEHRVRFAHLLKTGQPTERGFTFEASLRRADGSEFPAEVSIRRVPNEDPPEFAAAIKDISERKRGFERVRMAMEAAPIGMLMIDERGIIVLANAQIQAIFGYASAALLGTHLEQLLPERFRAFHPAFRQRFVRNPASRPMGAGHELFGLRRDGSEVPLEIGLSPIQTRDGLFVLASMVDVTEQKRAEAERARLVSELKVLTADLEQRVNERTRDARRSEERYRSLFEESPVALWEADFSSARVYIDGLRKGGVADLERHFASHPEAVAQASRRINILRANWRAIDLFEAKSARDLIGHLSAMHLADGADALRRHLVALASGHSTFEVDVERRTVTGRPIDIHLCIVVLPGHEADWSRVVCSMIDITAIRNAERQMQAAMTYQEVLLKEVHHRVKNNLAVVSSMLYLESSHTNDAHAVAVLEESRQRLRSMGLVHEALYQSDSLSEVDFGQYARTLATEIFSAFGRSAITLTIDADEVRLPLTLAIPLGLILNELLTNAFKHAFPHDRAGRVAIALRVAGSVCTMTVRDDGTGMPAHTDLEAFRSVGMRLIRSLAGQLRASISFEGGNPGTISRITFDADADTRPA